MLETERLIIRNFETNDSHDLFDYLSLPITYIFEPGEPITLEQATSLTEERKGNNDFLAVILKRENKMIGHLYFKQVEPLEFMTWELGYIFNPNYQNNGYCTEASRKIMEYGFLNLNAHKIVAFCNPKNPSSWHVLEKIGMKKEGVFIEKAFFKRDISGNPIWHDCFAYGLLHSEYKG
jgi:RimJ/RimL family protein N-acetyltransferase